LRSLTSTVTNSQVSPSAPDRGRLAEVGVARLLRAHRERKHTGILTFRCSNAVHYTVYFLEGDIIAASTDVEDLRLGSFLYRLNKITLEQLEESLAAAQAEQQLGEILVERGLLSAEERQDFLTAQFQEILKAVFLLPDAEYTFTPQETIFAENLQLFLDTDELIEEGTRLLEAVTHLSAELEAADPVYEVAESSELPERRDEQELLRYVDGARSAREILAISPFDHNTTVHLFHVLLARGILRPVAPRKKPRKQAPPPPTSPPTPPPENDGVSRARTVVRVGRSGSEDPDAGLFFSDQSVLDRVDLSHVNQYSIAHDIPLDGVVETVPADEEHEPVEAHEVVETHEAVEAHEEGEQEVNRGADDGIELDGEETSLSGIFAEEEAGEDTGEGLVAADDAEALLHIATDDIEFQETQVDTPLPEGATGPEAPTGGTRGEEGEAQRALLRYGFPEHPEGAEVTIEEEFDEEELDLLAEHITALEGSSTVEEIGQEAAGRIEPDEGESVSGRLEEALPLSADDQPLFTEPPILNDLSDDEIVIENGLDELEDTPLMTTPTVLQGTRSRHDQETQVRISEEQQAILNSITDIFKKPGARAALAGGPESAFTSRATTGKPLRVDASDSLDAQEQRRLIHRGVLYSDIFALIFSHYRKKLGDTQTRQVFDSFFTPGNSSYPELFIDVEFGPDGRLDSHKMVQNLVSYAAPRSANMFDACLNEVFYFLIKDIHLVLEPDEQDAMMSAIMPLRDRLFQQRPEEP